MGLGRLLVRGSIGALMAGHGAQKLLGWFGGGGPEGTGRMFEQAGLRPGRRNALAAGTAETTGGLMLAAGIATPLAGALLSGVMITAVRHVHWRNGPWVTSGGYEYNLVLLAAVFRLVEEDTGTGWALAALGAGAAGSLATTRLAQRHEVPDEATPREEAAEAEQPAEAR